MIIYNSRLARLFLKAENKHYFMLLGITFTRHKHCEYWEEMEMLIHKRQYVECMLLAALPVFILSCLFSCWFLLLIPLAYHILYWLERFLINASSFDREAQRFSNDRMYFRRRKFAAWRSLYARKNA
ncbi:hypothetical protein HMPREF1981_00164 [Bacteroides pyogenes F0041]|uniref:Uncharacterized protein n=1 Tax=Bacteroides pyogenes F0041 TaxID=1321819 RepID=U2CWI7_9BACE|nr:hypothetical protein HMPREF1981_00164 [Bacteroides pyogenes F0041]